jgi:hypothetical protein
MSRHRVLGAIRYPVFLIVWTAGVAAVAAQLQGIEASPVPDAPVSPAGAERFPVAAVASAPDLDDRDAWRDAVADMIRDTAVASGAWQPRRGEPAPGIDPVLAVIPVAPLPTATAGGRSTNDLAHADPQPAPGAAPETPVWKTPAVAARRDGDALKETGYVGEDRLRGEKAAGRMALRAGRYAEAYGRLRPVVAEAGRDAEFLGLLALAAVHVGSHGEALVLYRHLANLEPERGRWRAGLALAQQRLGLEPDEPGAAALAALNGTAAGDGGGLG